MIGQRSLKAHLRLESEVAGAVESAAALAAKNTWKCHPNANFCTDQFVLFRMRKTELKRMRKRILMMWMKKKVVMRMKVGIIGIGRMEDHGGKFLHWALLTQIAFP